MMDWKEKTEQILAVFTPFSDNKTAILTDSILRHIFCATLFVINQLDCPMGEINNHEQLF